MGNEAGTPGPKGDERLDRAEWDAITIAASVHDVEFLRNYIRFAGLATPIPPRVLQLVAVVAKHCGSS